MGLNIVDKPKTKNIKIIKKYSDPRYCFNLAFGLICIITFYIIQMVFSWNMLRVLKTDIDTGLWIAKK
jgi:hypothetical protein